MSASAFEVLANKDFQHLKLPLWEEYLAKENHILLVWGIFHYVPEGWLRTHSPKAMVVS